MLTPERDQVPDIETSLSSAPLDDTPEQLSALTEANRVKLATRVQS